MIRLQRPFLLFLFALLALSAWQWRHGPPVAADLLALLPQGAGDALTLQAEARMAEPLNREVLLLVGHPQRERLPALAERLGQAWSREPLFERVQWQLTPDLPGLRQQLLASRLALAPGQARDELIKTPDAYLQARAAALFDPFAGAGALPLEEDWLGLGLLLQRQLTPASKVQFDAGSGLLLTQGDGLSWALIRARTRADAFDFDAPPQVEALIEAARREVVADGGQLLAASGLRYAAGGQATASREMSLIGGLATFGTLALLLGLFRRWRVLLSLLAVGVALLAGSAACVLLFGQINAFTLILGASLTGVAADYPLHYLSKSWKGGPWDATAILRETLPGLSLSLATNLLGYLALACTPFPALTQVAVFSATGLIGAYLTTLCLLPAWWQRLDLAPPAAPLRVMQRLLDLRLRLLGRTGSLPLLLALLAFCGAGVWQLHLQNDLRLWLGQDPTLTREAQAIARLTGLQPTSQFFLVRGADADQVLERQTALGQRLDALVSAGQLQGYRALSGLLAPAAAQAELRQALAGWGERLQPLLAVGIPAEALEAELKQLQQLPDLSLDQALAGPLGEPWRPLWLGRTTEGGAAGLVSLQGLGNAEVLQTQAEGLPGVQLVDRLGELRGLFVHTQRLAVELKLLASGAIFLLLLWAFGRRAALRIVCLPLLAALAALACLGWLGQPLTLFSLFALLLITAIGVDYAILMHEAIGGAAVSLLGGLLSGVGSWLSFGLLMLSSTPAIANFGLAISLGLVFSFLLAPWASPPVSHEKDLRHG